MTLMLNLVSFIIPPFLETRCKFTFSYVVRSLVILLIYLIPPLALIKL